MDTQVSSEVEQVIPGFVLPEKYHISLYMLLQEYHREFGLQNGPTAMFWLITGIIGKDTGMKE